MREIKFRAWDGIVVTNKINPKHFSDGVLKFNPNRPYEAPIEIMQFTGLKDKNGVEIYEGDIVKTKWQDKAILLWDEEHACFTTETIDEIVKKERMYAMNDIHEVVGNIYQNPELLKN